MAKPTPPLTMPQPAELAKASLDNAVDMLDEAELLLTFRKWPRACSLAAEEYGKFYLAMAMRLDAATADMWTKFWSTLTAHQPKYTKLDERHTLTRYWDPVSRALRGTRSPNSRG